jgi:conjugal transfer mating pair stabilization protein TraG
MLMRTLSLLLALLPLPALAVTVNPPSGSAWDFYVIAGNVPIVSALLESVKAMTNPASNPEFRTLVLTFATAGFFGVIFVSMRGSPERIGKYIIAIWLLTYAMFSLRMNIVVTDNTNSQTQLVQDVPVVVGMPAAAIGTIGNWLTEKTELFFSLPNYDNLKLSQGAFLNMNAAMLEALGRVQITNPYIKQSLNLYMNDCVMPAVISGKLPATTLMQAQDLWGAMSDAKHPSIYTHWWSASGTQSFGTCEEAYGANTTTLTAYAPKLLSGIGERFSFIDATGAGGTYLKSALDASLQFSSATGGTADTAALQQGVIHAFRDSYKQSAAALGADEVLLSMNIEQAKAAQKTGWYTTAELFKEAVVSMYAVMQSFIIALAPIVMAAAVLPKIGMALMKGWAEVLVWLALWAPAFAVLNFIMSVKEQTAIKQVTASGITLMTDTALSEATVNYIVLAGMLTTLVPLILWQLVKGGSMAMTSVMERASGAAQAGSAAQNAAAGNFTAGNVSMNNMNANHHDLSHSRAYGTQPITLHNSAGATTEIIGMSGHQLQVGGNQWQRKDGYGDSAGRKQALQQSWARQEEASHGLSFAAAAAFRNVASTAAGGGVQTGGSNKLSHTNTQNQQTANQTAFETVYNHLRNTGLSKDEAFAITASAALRSGGHNGTADEVDNAKGDQGKIAGILSKIKDKGFSFMTDAIGLSSTMEARHASRNAVKSEDTLGVGNAAKDATTDQRVVGAQSAQGNEWVQTNGTQTTGQTGQDFASGFNFQQLDQATKKFLDTKQAVDAAERAYTASTNYSMPVGMNPKEIAKHRAEFDRRIKGANEAITTGELPNNGTPPPPLRAEVQGELTNTAAAVAGAGQHVYGQGQAVHDEAAERIADAKAAQEREKKLASQQAVNPELAFQAKADRVDAVNNDRFTAVGQHLKEAEDMDDTRSMMFATAGGIYAADRLPLGPIGAAIGGGLAAGGVYAITKAVGNEVEEHTTDMANVQKFQSPQDITMNGKVVGEAMGFALDKDGNASTIYRYDTGQKNDKGESVMAYGVWKETEGSFMKIDGLDFGPKQAGQPIGVNRSGATTWANGSEPTS